MKHGASSNCIFIAYCFLVDFWQQMLKCCLKAIIILKNPWWPSQEKKASCSHAWPSHILPVGFVKHWLWHRSRYLVIGSVPVCFCYKCLSQFGQFESCSLNSYQQRGELAVSGTNSKSKQKRPRKLQKALFWQKHPHLMHRYCCHHHPKQIWVHKRQ